MRRKATELARDTAELLRAVAAKPAKHFTSALIAAAGSSTRMGTSTSKQLLDIDGTPVLARTLLAYEHAATVQEIVIVARKEDFDTFRALAEQYKITKLKRITTGGATRQDSVLRGLSSLSPKTRFVAIADGARCLITPEQIDRVNLTAYRTDAASAAVPATDTVKLTDEKGRAISTPDRSRVWLAQTPQTFSLALYRAAAYYAKENGVEATDDNALLEAVGHPVTMVDCGKENIKITTPGDIDLARAILARRADEQKEENV
jgi:2-C-methyl-D-erythritol 4-phosphate cytidylyltransferase